MTIKKYPEWKQALGKVLERFKKEGYGFFISFDDLYRWMDIRPPQTIAEYKTFQFTWLNAIDNLKKTLLEDHNIFLMNSRGQGYQVCTPDDQIEKGFQSILRKARAEIRKATKVLMCVDTELLSMEGKAKRLNNLARVAFITNAMNRRKIPKPQEKKAIEG